MIDLHTHSRHSDGSDPAAEVVARAAHAGCEWVALTDHDRLDGIPEAKEAARSLGIGFVAGCEISCRLGSRGCHVLAYFAEPGDGPLQRELARVQAAREERNVAMIERLAQAGIPITYAEVLQESGGGSTGRPHIAAILLQKGIVGSLQEAFDRWIGEGRPGYVTTSRLDPARAARLAAGSNAVVSLAHPLRIGLPPAQLRSLVAELAEAGFAGIEAYHSGCSPAEREALAGLAREFDLVATGGSDYHGHYKPEISIGTGKGDLCLGVDVIEELAARRPRS